MLKKYINNLKEQKEMINDFSDSIVNLHIESSIHIFKPDEGASINDFFNKLYDEIILKKTDSLNVYTDFTIDNSIETNYEKSNFKKFINLVHLKEINFMGTVNFDLNSEFDFLSKHGNDLFIIKYWQLNDSQIHELVIKLIRQSKSIEKSLSKKIYIILAYNEYFEHFLSDKTLDLNLYTIKKLSLEDAKAQLTEMFDVKEGIFENFYQLTNGNIKELEYFFRCYKEDTHINKTSFLRAKENLIKSLIMETEKILRDCEHDTVSIMSILPKYLDPYIVNKIDTTISLNQIDTVVQSLKAISVLHQVDEKFFYFLEDAKLHIQNIHNTRRQIIYEKYYIYLKKQIPLEYIKRANVLIEVDKNESNFVALYILALGEAYRKRDKIILHEIKEKISLTRIGEGNAKLFDNIYSLYFDDLNDEDNKIDSFYKKIIKDNPLLNVLIKTELLKNDIIRLAPIYTPGDSLNHLCDSLLNELQSMWNLTDIENIHFEKAHFSACLLVLYPHIKDKFNDAEKAKKINCMLDDIKKNDRYLVKCLEYYEQIKMRKSFMDVPIDMALENYNQALSYFKKIGDVSEQYMTLSGLLGLYITIFDFNKCSEVRKEIHKMRTEHDSQLFPAYYKTENNFFVFDFLKNEKNSDETDIKKTIAGLEDLLDGANYVSKCVILTNLASLSLYLNSVSSYEVYKTRLENLMCCNDCSDLEDTEIDDFYRFYFSWFEFAKYLILKDNQKAQEIYKNIKTFIPLIFESKRSLFEKKWKSYTSIFEEKEPISGKIFCDWAIKSTRSFYREWNFFARGLMLSDLQHTSFF